MEDTYKLTIALTFSEEDSKWISKLAKKTSEGKSCRYIASEGSIPHLTLVQASFDKSEENGKPRKISRKIEQEIRNKRLFSVVPDLVVSSKASWTSNSASGVYTGLYIHNDTMLQGLHNKCVEIVEGLGGKVTSSHGMNFFPHLTLALLNAGEVPVEISHQVKRRKVLNAPNLIVGTNGDGGSLVKVHFETLNPLYPKGSLNRNTQLRDRG